MTRIAVTGLPFFASRAATGLTEVGFDAQYVPRPSRNARSWPGFLLGLARSGTVYSIGSSAARGSPNDRLSQLGKRMIMHWVGSDVLKATNDFRSGLLSDRLVGGATHWADAPWLVEELEALGIQATEQSLPIPMAIGTPTPLPDDFKVLVYLPAGEHRAHDIDGTLSVISALPDIQFAAVGGRIIESAPPNLENLGFVEDMPSLYRECSAFLRLTHHDGLSHSVVEALSFGRHTLWTFEIPGVTLVDGPQRATEKLRQLKMSADEGSLATNIQGAEAVTERYGGTTPSDNLARAMRQALRRPRTRSW